MTAGKYDRRITIERATYTDNGLEEVETWSVLAAVWAKVTPISDGERFRSGEVAAHNSHRFLIRYSSTVASVNAKDRVLFDGMTFDISGVKEVGRREEIEITAAARAD